MDCIKLNNNINECATTNPFRRWDEVAYILPYEDVTNVVFNGMTVKFDTIGTAFSVRDRRLNPFSGSGSEFVQGDMGSVSWTERVNFPALANSVDNSTIANAIANGGRVVVILKQVDYESDGKGKYQVFGIDGGLRIDTMPFDPYADAAWNVTLIAEKMSRPAVYLWDTDEATTDAKWSLITQYEYITGLSLADGSLTPQVVYLASNIDKTSYVVLPDGTTLTSTDGVINTTWNSAAGAVTLIVPKNEIIALWDADTISSDFVGQLNTNSVGVDCNGCTLLTSISAQNAITISCGGCTSLTSISAPNATIITASGCALTAVAIAALLAELVATGKEDGTLDISGGTNADYATWSSQAKADAATLQTREWTVTYNEA